MPGRERVAVKCGHCGRVRHLLHPKRAGDVCRKCALGLATVSAAVANSTPTVEKFERYVDRSGNCWVWTGYRYSNGYAVITAGQKQVLCHRWSYEHHVGPIPDGLVIDHLCRNKACVNPGHLEPVTPRENTRRAMRTHCVNGHPFDDENTWVYRGKRYCRECRRVRCRARYERSRGAKEQA